MNNTDYYSILGIHKSATQEQIKEAYIKLALVHHPDINSNSQESNLRFIVIKNAYEILTNGAKKKAYDKFLRRHNTYNNKKKKYEIVLSDNKIFIKDFFDNRFNYIMWDIEDLLHKVNQISFNKVYLPTNLYHDILLMCLYIDKYVLNIIGLNDPMNDLRQSGVDISQIINQIHYRNDQLKRFAYSSIGSYFYDLRVRMNKFIEKIDSYNIYEIIHPENKTIFELWIGVQDYLIKYINKINDSMEFDEIY